MNKGVIKKAIILFVLVSAFFTVKAQDYVRPSGNYTAPETGTPIEGSKKFVLGISLGAAIPSGSFASTNVKNSFWDFNSTDSTHLQGFAKTGFHFNITATYQFTDDFGLTLLLGNSSNPFDINAFSSAIGYPAGSQSSNFTTAEYLLGPCFSLPISNKFKFRVSLLAGIVTNNYPTIDVALNDTTTYEVTFNGATNFAYSIGAGIIYNVTDNIAVQLNLNYTGTTITYTGWTGIYTINGGVYSYYPYTSNHPNDVTSMTAGLLKPTFGVEFKF